MGEMAKWGRGEKWKILFSAIVQYTLRLFPFYPNLFKKASAAFIPSRAELMMPPEYPDPSPMGKRPWTFCD
jgi:hypothetical protein